MDQLNSWWRDTTGSRVTPSMYLDSFGETVYMVCLLYTSDAADE